MKLCLENQDYTWPFILAEVKTPLLRADFLQTHGLLVDLQSQRLVNTTSFTSSTLKQSNQPALCLHHVASDDPYKRILDGFPAITRPVPLFVMVLNISSPQPARLCMLELAGYHQINLLLLRMSSGRWKKWGSYDDQIARGRLPYTWCLKTPVVGDYRRLNNSRPISGATHSGLLFTTCMLVNFS